MVGPAIRYWEFARVLSDHFTVTLAIPPFVKQGSLPSPPFEVKIRRCQNEADLDTLAWETEVIVTVGDVLSHYPRLLKTDKPLVLDTYIPFLIENLNLYPNRVPTHEDLLSNERDRNAHSTQLRVADFIICASERQRDYWLGFLTALGRINPYTHHDDKTLRRLIDVVPFGLPKDRPIHTRQVLKGVYKSIKSDDDVLIWTGGIWKWLDASTLIKAMPLVIQERPNVKLFFMGTRRPDTPSTSKIDVEAITLSKELGLYDTHIFFNDWTPYHERQNYLLEADLGVSLHSNHIETKFAFRTRSLDHLWTGLPLVATEGDVMSAELSSLNLARIVKAGDVEGVAQAIIEMLNAPEIRQKYQANLESVVAKYQWEVVTKPLIEFCAQPYFAPDKAYLKSTLVIEVGPTPYWKLPQKAWRILKDGGLRGFLRQLKGYVLWKQG